MGNFFPRWTNFVPLKLAAALLVLACGATMAITYYWTPKNSRVGYMPQQPIPFKHTVHAGELGMDCRYCHSFVENSSHANVPTAQTCWNCHQFILKEDDRLKPLRAAMDKSWEGYTGEPIQWVKVHKVPEYAYFNHQVHVNRGVSCVSCHGNIKEMEVVYQKETQSMGWCLECHRSPENALRPLDQITNLDWKPSDLKPEELAAIVAKAAEGSDPHAAAPAPGIDPAADPHGGTSNPAPVMPAQLTQLAIGTQLKEAWGVRPPESCTGCHR